MTRSAIDLFAGAGGATQGLVDAGFRVIGAVEYDSVAARSYKLNHPDVRLWDEDIRKVPATRVMRELGLDPGELGLLKACPPCQGFSSLAEGRVDVDERQNDLVLHTIRFVRALRPQAVLVENVPGLGRDLRAKQLREGLRRLGYLSHQYQVNAVDFGVPQRRRRLIILAVRGLRSMLPATLSPVGVDGGRSADVSVRTAFEQLAQDVVAGDGLHQPRKLSALVEQRIAAIPVGGSRFDLPAELKLKCHTDLDARKKGRDASGSYGRLRLDEPAPTLTTRCTTPACGSFIHPTLDRAITLREAAALQTFPPAYQFSGSHGEIERQIGNAVPVKMAAAIGGVVLELLA